MLDIAGGQQTYLYLDRQVAVGTPLQISDSPAQQVDDTLRQFTVNENFLTTLMFRSDKNNSTTWVMLFSLVWGWNAVANRTGPGTWVLADGECQIETYGWFTPGYLIPSWDSNITQYNYQAGSALPPPPKWPFIDQVTHKLSRRNGPR